MKELRNDGFEHKKDEIFDSRTLVTVTVKQFVIQLFVSALNYAKEA